MPSRSFVSAMFMCCPRAGLRQSCRSLPIESIRFLSSTAIRRSQSQYPLEVQLSQNVPNVGPKGSIKMVSPGFGRNYLLRNGLGHIVPRDKRNFMRHTSVYKMLGFDVDSIKKRYEDESLAEFVEKDMGDVARGRRQQAYRSFRMLCRFKKMQFQAEASEYPPGYDKASYTSAQKSQSSRLPPKYSTLATPLGSADVRRKLCEMGCEVMAMPAEESMVEDEMIFVMGKSEPEMTRMGTYTVLITVRGFGVIEIMAHITRPKRQSVSIA